MDGMTLLKRSREAGLTVFVDGSKLVIRGPRSAERMAHVLMANKPEVMAVLNSQNSDASGGDGDTTPEHSGRSEVVSPSLCNVEGESPIDQAGRVQPPAHAAPRPSTSPQPTTKPPWPVALARWALRLRPRDLPSQFVLRQGVEVIDRNRFLASLQRDAQLGPDGPRACYGALQGDLAALRRILIPEEAGK